MKLVSVVVGASLVAALSACHKSGDSAESNSPGSSTTPISNSAGSYAPGASGVPGANGDATGVGATGVSPNDIRNAPTPDTTVPSSPAMEPTAPVGPTP